MHQTHVEQKRFYAACVFTLCERLGVAVAIATGGAAMYWYGHQLGVLMGFVFITIGMLVIFFGFSMSICSSGMFLQDCFGKNLSRIKIFFT